jgi:GT2 family glycosyltransferase
LTLSPDFSVLIVNYNGGAFLQGALDSLARQTHRNFEVILIDNASTDGSVGDLRTGGLPSFRLMRESQNHGFARGNNLAAEQARGRWIVLLNPDAEAAPEWLAELAAAAARHPSIRTFASAQFTLGDETRMDGAGDAYLLFGFPWRGGFGHKASAMPSGDGWCFSACGASAMYDASLFRELGGFDERFFCYCEDVDLGFRLQRRGEDCLFVRGAVIRHAGGGIAGQASAFATYHGTRNRLWTYAKNMPLPLLIPTLPGHLALTLYVVVRNAFTPRFRPMMKGLWHGLLGVGGVASSRHWRQSDLRISLWQLARRMAWNPWRMSARRTHVRVLTVGPKSTAIHIRQ